MASAITDEVAACLNWTPRADAATADPDLPRSIPTPATEFAPRGRIIDDSARGTIFWEADPDDADRASLIDEEVVDGAVVDDGVTPDPAEMEAGDDAGAEVEAAAAAAAGVHSFGKPFQIEWVTTNRLPFYRTRGLRNPWNANREVKIARDGTELETSVGRRLVQMFQKPPPGPGPGPGRPH